MPSVRLTTSTRKCFFIDHLLLLSPIPHLQDNHEGTKRYASAAMNAHNRPTCFRSPYISAVDRTGPRHSPQRMQVFAFHPHSTTLPLPECVRRTGLYTRGGVAADDRLCLKSGTRPAGERMRIPQRCHDRLWCKSLAHVSEQE